MSYYYSIEFDIEKLVREEYWQKYWRFIDMKFVKEKIEKTSLYSFIFMQICWRLSSIMPLLSFTSIHVHRGANGGNPPRKFPESWYLLLNNLSRFFYFLLFFPPPPPRAKKPCTCLLTSGAFEQRTTTLPRQWEQNNTCCLLIQIYNYSLTFNREYLR